MMQFLFADKQNAKWSKICRISSAFGIMMHNPKLVIWNQRTYKIFRSRSRFIKWDLLPVNSMTTMLFSEFRLTKKILDECPSSQGIKRRKLSEVKWLESREWMETCNDEMFYDN